MSETIIQKDAIELYERDMSLYSIIVNRRRALPSINDGLKVVQRRIVYQAFKNGLYGRKDDKSGALVGDVMGKLHPHGDSSIYGAIVNLATWFTTKYPIMSECSTGYGAADGSVASAMRYTHAGLSEFGYDCIISDLSLSENIINKIETYKKDGSLEPEYLPAKIPNLLINGSSGIAVGTLISVPSHNLGEVIDVTRKLLRDPNAKFCLIPDLCQACDLIDTNWQEINDTGSGTFKARGRIDVEQDKSGDYILHIRSLPPQVFGDTVYEKILDLVDAKKLPIVKDVYSSLDKDKRRPDVKIHLRPGSDPEYVKQIIYAQTPVSQTVSVNFEAVRADGLDTFRFSYRQYLLAFIDIRLNTKFRLYCNKLQQVMTREHVLDAYIKVLESKKLDEIIAMIRKQKSTDETPIIEYIIKHCGTTDVQAKFIIGTNIGRLTYAHLQKYKNEFKDLAKEEAYYKSMIDEHTGEQNLINELDQELLEIKKKYDTPRICSVISANQANNIPAGTFKIVITENNYIRKIPDNDKITVVKKDNPKLILRIDNTENLLIFDNKGRVFMLPVHKVQICDKSSVGQDIRYLLKNCTADIIAVFNENIFKTVSKSGNKHYLTVLTRNNLIKKMDIEDFLAIPSGTSGFIYSKVAPDDEVVSLALIAHGLDIVVGSNHKVLRFNLKEVSVVKRNAFGVTAMRTEDPIGGMSILYPDTSDIIVVTKNGKFNRFPSTMMTPHKRATGGQNCIKLDSTDEIFAILAAGVNDSIKITTLDGVEIIPVNTIKSKSPIAPGQRYIQSKSQVLKAEIVRS